MERQSLFDFLMNYLLFFNEGKAKGEVKPLEKPNSEKKQLDHILKNDSINSTL